MRAACLHALVAVTGFNGAMVVAAEPPAGAYAIEVRLEIPNVDAWRWSATHTICLPGPRSGHLPMPLLSPNHPFAECRAADVVHDGAELRYEIVCRGRDAARAHATYRFRPDGFEGRITITLGAKNMTMRELQSARRIGDCAVLAGPPDTD
jgi:hypothetical protein